MTLRSRLPLMVLGLVALVLGVLIVLRVSAGADPAPRDTSPIVIKTPHSPPSATPTRTPTAPVTKVAPPPRHIDDDGHHQRGKGKGGGGDDGSGGDD